MTVTRLTPSHHVHNDITRLTPSHQVNTDSHQVNNDSPLYSRAIVGILYSNVVVPYQMRTIYWLIFHGLKRVCRDRQTSCTSTWQSSAKFTPNWSYCVTQKDVAQLVKHWPRTDGLFWEVVWLRSASKVRPSGQTGSKKLTCMVIKAERNLGFMPKCFAPKVPKQHSESKIH